MLVAIRCVGEPPSTSVRLNVCVCARVCTCVHACARVCARVRACARVCARVCACARLCARMCACVRVYARVLAIELGVGLCGLCSPVLTASRGFQALHYILTITETPFSCGVSTQ